VPSEDVLLSIWSCDTALHAGVNEGIGPSGAARLLVEAGDITRFPNRGHFSWNGTAPTGASSGDHVRHRLSRTRNRQVNRVLHIMAVVQFRHPPGAHLL
jgi:transposase